MNKRNQYTAEQKTNIVLEVLREEQMVNEIAAMKQKQQIDNTLFEQNAQ